MGNKERRDNIHRIEKETRIYQEQIYFGNRKKDCKEDCLYGII